MVVLRCIQGIGLGGEWGGSILLAMEWARSTRRGFVTAWPQLGAPVGFFLANLAILACSRISGDEFLNWGWRIPFWLSLGLAGIGLWIRRDIPETPTFRKMIEGNQVARKPVVEVLKHRPREIVVTALVQTAQTVASFVYSAFFIVYGTKTLGMSRDFLLGVMLIASCTSLFTIPFSGYLSDRFGRKKIFMFGAAGTGLFAFAYFALLDTALPGPVVLATLIAFFFHNLMWGSVAVLAAECFAPRLRYSGTSIGYQFATALAGGTAPMIATALLLWTGASQMIAIYVFASAIVSIAAAATLPDNPDFTLNQAETNETPSWYA
jgi:MFS family permease